MRGDDFCSGFEEVCFETYWGMVLESEITGVFWRKRNLGWSSSGWTSESSLAFSGQRAGTVWHAYCGPRRALGSARLDTVSCPLPCSVPDAGISVRGEVTPAWTDPLGETGLFVVLGNRRGELGRTWQEGDMAS